MQSYLKSNNLYKQCKTKIITLSLFAAHGCENVHYSVNLEPSKK